jgi:hypothetical protein
MANRFDFEQSLLGYFRVEEDVKAVYRFLLDKSDLAGDDLDKVANMLLGISELYSVKSDALFDMFEELVYASSVEKK